MCRLHLFLSVRLLPSGLTALKHPNIIRLVQHINSPQNVIMVFELAEGGDLFQFLCAAPGQRVDEEEGRSLFRQVRSVFIRLSQSHQNHPPEPKVNELQIVPTGKYNYLSG